MCGIRCRMHCHQMMASSRQWVSCLKPSRELGDGGRDSRPLAPRWYLGPEGYVGSGGRTGGVTVRED